MAIILLGARSSLHRPKQKLLRIEGRLSPEFATAHSSGIPALRRPSYVRSFVSRRGGSPPCAE